MRIDTGEYRIDYFDKYGGRLKTEEQKAESLTYGISMGERKMEASDTIVSFTIVRQVYNSLDDRRRW